MLLHGNGADEHDFFPLHELFPASATVAALRAPIPSEGGYRWYAHHAVGQPTASSLADGVAYAESWLDANARGSRGIWLVGFSGGAVLASTLLLKDPHRYAGVALLHGSLPFGAGVELEPGRLAGCEVFYAYGEADAVMPPALVARSCDYLREHSGARAEIRGYRAGHEIPPAEQRDLARWYEALT